MSDFDNDEYNHDDFVVVRADERFGGFEEVKLKDQNDALPKPKRFFRKSLTPNSVVEIDDLIALQGLVMKEGCSGIIHPMYTHNDRKWAVMSVPDEHYGTTGLAG